MSLVRTHNRDFFYKYFTFDGAVKTLQRRQFLYRAPAFFNDPFDTQLDLLPGISDDEATNIFFDILTKAIIDKRVEPRLGLPQESLENVLPIVEGKTYSEIKEILLTASPKNYFSTAYKKAFQNQRDSFQNNFVFCATEKFDNLLMWSHYANEHKGAVFKIKCIEEKESLLCAALKVNYSEKYPTFGTSDDWIKAIGT